MKSHIKGGSRRNFYTTGIAFHNKTYFKPNNIIVVFRAVDMINCLSFMNLCCTCKKQFPLLFFFFLAGRPGLFFLTRPELSERTEELWTLESSCSDSSSSISSL